MKQKLKRSKNKQFENVCFKISNMCVGVLLIVLTAIVFPANAQCGSETFLDKCSSALEEFTFIKSYELENNNGEKGEYSYVFSKGSIYKIVICDENIAGSRMIVTLFDRNRKMIASNYDKRTKKFYPTLNYPCSATGVYYIEYTFEGNKAKCGVNILGFSKQ